MGFLEEVLNIVFQEYGGTLLLVVSIVMSIALIVPFTHIVSNNIFIINKLHHVISTLWGALND
ncbi:hypothetical protein [Vulcanisaeta thermophila]|uniref:hypothetical protein n=1 Tax=Vulcanisaeta thermophila TaxID=867917 RepID=UPI000853B5EF|nr:hypothetical protein [Vulcanisaeta thermophila]